MKSYNNSHLKDAFYRDKPFMNSPVPIVLILGLYLLFVKKIGPNWMKNKPAYNLSQVLIVYNIIQVLFSTYVGYLGSCTIWNHGLFDRRCTAYANPNLETTLFAGYCYVLAKISELLDTVFFVLRKKQSQVSFLHVYHHFVIVAGSWVVMMYDNSFSGAFLATLNSFIHVIMYGYYLLSTFPSLHKYLWWKKYLTAMQMIQFVLVILHMLIFISITKCPHTYTLIGIIIVNLFFFIYLFAQFYIKSYVNKDENKCKNKDGLGKINDNGDEITKKVI